MKVGIECSSFAPTSLLSTSLEWVSSTRMMSTKLAALESGSYYRARQTSYFTDDGSRSIEAIKIDTSGKGDDFGPTASVIANGDPHPTNDATQQILAQLAASALCTGGSDGNRRLASFTRTDGWIRKLRQC
ncbi:hypothetical protein F5888DRAFT_1116181 [Russula emetica]|nr:hypothetical protein F5888DRAFT_1116181 [Russula emetica]